MSAEKKQQMRARDESGYALLTVIGVLMVTITIAALVSSMTVHALGFTSQTRASVQSQAAADAGISAGRVLLETEGACTTALTSVQSTDPAYKVTVWRGTGAGGWDPGCPLAATTKVRLISTGWANDDGAVGQSGGDVSYEELVLTSKINQSSGSAVYIGGGGGQNGFNGFKITSGNGETADIRVKNGDWVCTHSGTYEGNIIVENGSAKMENACTITGWIWASGDVTVKNGTQIGGDITAGANILLESSTTKVGGNAYANGTLTVNAGKIVGSAESLGLAYIGADGSIGGSLWTKKLGTIAGKVGGNVISSDPSQKTTFFPSAKVTGNFTIGGPIDTWITPCNGQYTEAGYLCGMKQQGNVGGTVLARQSGLPSPVAKAPPSVPGWYDFGYSFSDWQSAGYVQELKWPVGACSVTNNTATAGNIFFAQLSNTTLPTVVNALDSGCDKILFSLSAHVRLKLKTNITFVGKGFTLEDMQVDSFDSNVRQFNLMVPDGKPTVAGRTCNDNSKNSILFNNGTKLTDKVYGMIYTPCDMGINNASGWRGQIYTGTMSFSNADSLVYLPIGIPNANLDGESVGSEKTAFAVASSRNRRDNGE